MFRALRGHSGAYTAKYPEPLVRLLGGARPGHGFRERPAGRALLAPSEVLLSALDDAYSPFVTVELLDKWTSQPQAAPGRKVSSPWPDRIEITGISTEEGVGCQVKGETAYITSRDLATGERGSGAGGALGPGEGRPSEDSRLRGRQALAGRTTRLPRSNAPTSGLVRRGCYNSGPPLRRRSGRSGNSVHSV
jgi:hypothetical protein